jgi:hypothetical protein
VLPVIWAVTSYSWPEPYKLSKKGLDVASRGDYHHLA